MQTDKLKNAQPGQEPGNEQKAEVTPSSPTNANALVGSSLDGLDYNKIRSIEFEGIDHKDAPDYCDAYIVYAEYDGEPMSDEQIEELNDDSDFVYERLMDYLY